MKHQSKTLAGILAGTALSLLMGAPASAVPASALRLASPAASGTRGIMGLAPIHVADGDETQHRKRQKAGDPDAQDDGGQAPRERKQRKSQSGGDDQQATGRQKSSGSEDGGQSSSRRQLSSGSDDSNAGTGKKRGAQQQADQRQPSSQEEPDAAPQRRQRNTIQETDDSTPAQAPKAGAKNGNRTLKQATEGTDEQPAKKPSRTVGDGDQNNGGGRQRPADADAASPAEKPASTTARNRNGNTEDAASGDDQNNGGRQASGKNAADKPATAPSTEKVRQKPQPDDSGEAESQPDDARPAQRGRNGSAQEAARDKGGAKASVAEPDDQADSEGRPRGEQARKPASDDDDDAASNKGGGSRDASRQRGGDDSDEAAELPPGEAPSAGASQREAPAGEAPARRQKPPVDAGPPPSDDRAAQADVRHERVESVDAEQGTRRREGGDPDDEPQRRQRPNGTDVLREIGNRLILRYNDQVMVESSDRDRLARNSRDTYTEDLPRGRTRETVIRRDGTRVVTVRNSYGDIIRRSRITPDGREYVLSYVEDEDDDRVRDWRDPGLDLPPFRPNVPQDQYILDTEQDPNADDYYQFLDKPPVERVERLYSVDEVKRSARIRQKTRRIDLDTLTFDFGSSTIADSEVEKLDGVAQAMQRLLKANPAESFLIEGHTDAVGSDEANLALSDRRAEAVAEALTNVFEIPPENLVTQGYGEQYLKVNVQGPERENRRVAIRRITPLVTPVASAN